MLTFFVWHSSHFCSNCGWTTETIAYVLLYKVVDRSTFFVFVRGDEFLLLCVLVLHHCEEPSGSSRTFVVVAFGTFASAATSLFSSVTFPEIFICSSTDVSRVRCSRELCIIV